MKKYKVYHILLTVLCVLINATQATATYIEAIDIYEYSIGEIIGWTHTYDYSEDPIDSALLTIVADDVDGPGNNKDGGQHEVWLKDSVDTWHYLGLLNDIGYFSNWSYYPGPGNPDQPLTSTTFALEPLWINSGFPVEVRIEANWGIEIETSTLSISQVPEPATICLLGLGGLALLRRRKSA